MALWPRPASCGKMNHIQWVRLQPAVSSSTTRPWTGACAVVKRRRSDAVTGAPIRPVSSLEHVPQKWEPVLRKGTCSNKRIEQDDDSKKSHSALSDAGAIAGRIGSAGAAALAARRPACRGNGDAGNAVLLHVDRAKHGEIAALPVRLQFAQSHFLAQQGIAVARRVEAHGIEIEREVA